VSIELALADAANNCAKHSDAVATITFRSGRQLSGRLKRPSGADLGTRQVEIGRGWVTFRIDEVAAVQSRLRQERTEPS
jgi:hypothetical protein